MTSATVHRDPDQAPSARVTAGAASAVFGDGGLRWLHFGGTEVLRGLSAPVRDADWGTVPVRTVSETLDRTADGLVWQQSFEAQTGDFSGTLRIALAAEADGAVITATIEIAARRGVRVNRAGFVLLHPLAGVVGTPMTVRHPGGGETRAAFAQAISPGQTARAMAGLVHRVGPVTVDIELFGEVFEMEDQRNWSDASFKTYCRPLSEPHPFTIEPGAPVRQQVVIRLSDSDRPDRRHGPAPVTARMPHVALAHEPGIAAGDLTGNLPILARLSQEATEGDLSGLAGLRALTLELVAEDRAGLRQLAERCKANGLEPSHVVALPPAYLKSHQPGGPWPAGDTPDDFAPVLREVFPGVPVGVGSLTHFTELNRCPPGAEGDFVTFGNSAVVHAADDASVMETLEGLAHILPFATKLAGGRPLRLGLVSIGMRSNPYGTGVVPNPGGLRLAMARSDPRQGTEFAAAYAVGVLAAAARARVESLALAMTGGPLGAQGPLARVIAQAHRMAGAPVTVAEGEGWVTLSGPEGGLAANLRPEPTAVPGAGSMPACSAAITDRAA